MANVIGPTNRLPGQTIGFVPDGRDCDRCNLLAKHAVVGECDSMGAEVHHLCSEHFLEMQKELIDQQKEEQVCDLCHNLKQDCRPFRDPEEGSTGPVYLTCPECRQRLVSYFYDDSADDSDY